jgi:germination protein M
MSEKIDRRIEGSRVLLWSLVALFAVAAGAGLFAWQRLSAPTLPQNQPAQTPIARPDEPLTITLYYPADGMLAAGPCAVKRQADTQAQAREVLSALFTDPRAAQSAVFTEIRLREFFLDASGSGYVDLSITQPNGVKASAWEELLAIYAMVDSLTQNFEDIKQVRFLLEGRETQTLAGHIDLSRRFEKRMDLVKQ